MLRGAAVKRVLIASLVLAFGALFATTVFAQDDDDAVLKLAEPDFTLASLPTALRLPEHKMAFRVTHRFTRPLSCDACSSSLLGDAFGIDSGAQIGLELRFAPIRSLQVGVHRTSNKTIAFFGEYGVVRQGHQLPVEVAILASIDGTNNFQDIHSPSVGAVVSRRIGEWVALYAEPIWVHITNPLPTVLVDQNDTFLVGIGGRFRVSSTVYIVAEMAPRAGGYKPGVNHGSFAIEKRLGGHMFQLNFSDSFATTMSQIARGGTASKDWYLGFNISRKFF
jgi:hypothetical protein